MCATGSLYASGGGLGFARGGCQDAGTTPDSSQLSGGQIVWVPGLVTYSMSSEAWCNISALGYSTAGFALDGTAQLVPAFGAAGLFFIFGGTVTNRILAGTDSVAIFHPNFQQWSS